MTVLSFALSVSAVNHKRDIQQAQRPNIPIVNRPD